MGVVEVQLGVGFDVDSTRLTATLKIKIELPCDFLLSDPCGVYRLYFKH